MTVKKDKLLNKAKNDEEYKLIERLVNFGFSRNESLIYIYLLHKGTETGGTKIAIGTGLHRQYVYISLPLLIKEGLVEEIKYGKQSKYKARPPHVLETIGRKKALVAGDLARDLNNISAIGNEQDFEVIQGKRAIQEYEFMYVKHATENDEEFIIGGASSSVFVEIMGDTLKEYLEEKKKKKIKVKYIGTEDEKDFYQNSIGKFENQDSRFLKKLPKGKTHIVVRKESVSFFSFLNPPLVYVLKSKEIADNYRSFFNMLWEMAEEQK